MSHCKKNLQTKRIKLIEFNHCIGKIIIKIHIVNNYAVKPIVTNPQNGFILMVVCLYCKKGKKNYKTLVYPELISTIFILKSYSKS